MVISLNMSKFEHLQRLKGRVSMGLYLKIFPLKPFPFQHELLI